MPNSELITKAVVRAKAKADAPKNMGPQGGKRVHEQGKLTEVGDAMLID